MDNHQLTVREMAILLAAEVKKGNGDKLLIGSNDVEGNGYHGIWYGPTDAKDLGIGEYGVDINDTMTKDLDKLICIG